MFRTSRPRSTAFAALLTWRKITFASAPLLILAGCAALPVSGPTGHEIVKGSADPKTNFPFRLVEINDFSALPAALPALREPLEEAPPAPPTDLIGPGDILDISVYEAGVALFTAGGGRNATAAAPSTGFDGAAQVTRLPLMRVDDDGYIRVPYAGRLRAAGETSAQLQSEIRKALLGKSQDPQVAVRIDQSVSNSVIVGGEIQKAGRLTLTTNRETISEVLALTGGYRGEAKDLTVHIERGNRNFQYRLSDLLGDSSVDARVLPGDHIEVVRQPMTFSVMGAPGKVELMPFAAPSLSLTEAVSMVGGANSALGDAKAIFVFRFIPGADGKEEPVVYHLNMMSPGSFFLAQRFAMRDKDILYIGNAAANQPSKLIQVMSQLFSPVIAVESGLVNTGTIR